MTASPPADPRIRTALDALAHAVAAALLREIRAGSSNAKARALAGDSRAEAIDGDEVHEHHNTVA